MKTVRVYEMEEGRQYKNALDGTLYRIVADELERFSLNGEWVKSSEAFNKILKMEFIEVELDPNTLVVNTKLMVKILPYQRKTEAYFAKCNQGKVCVWSDGRTSFTQNGVTYVSEWELYKGDKNDEI